LLGNFDSFSQASAQLWGRYRFTNGEWYAMDTWKVLPNLTLDLGIRFMYLEPMYDAKNQIGTFQSRPVHRQPEGDVVIRRRSPTGR